MTKLYLVVPCYNEQEVLPRTNSVLIQKMQELIAKNRISKESRILYVDDGSKDATWKLLSSYHYENELVCALKLAHNRGHQNALLAGLETAKDECDCAISLDADLQDDIEVFEQFLDKFEEGCDIVYGVRKKRETDTAFKRMTAEGFYKVMAALGTKIVFNHADYRLMSRRALEALSEYKEVNLFLRGIVCDIGYKNDVVYYDRLERTAGESKYPLKKMLSFALEGITSFSVAPLKWITGFGIILLLVSIAGFIAELIMKNFVSFAGIAVLIGLACSLNLIAVGLVGTYIGKIYSEAKQRPRYKTEEYLKH